jgi:hypothetical protein
MYLLKLIVILVLSVDTSISSTDNYRRMEADKPVAGLYTMLVNRRHSHNLPELRYCADLSSECYFNNQFQRRYGLGEYTRQTGCFVANDGMFAINVFSKLFSEGPGYYLTLNTNITKFGAHYDGHFWTVIFE